MAKQVIKFLGGIDRKHLGQISLKLFSLLEEPNAPDVKPLKGSLRDYLRADSGEYRIIFFVDDDVLRVVEIGRRNDGAIYKYLIPSEPQ